MTARRLPIAAIATAAAVIGLDQGPAQAAAPAPAPPPSPAPAAPAPVPATLYLMDQIATGPLPQALLDQMQPLHRLDDIEALLKANKVGFAWREAEVSSAQMQPQLVRQLATLPPHEVFIAPQAQGWIISVILSERAAPPSPPAPAPPKR